MGTPLVFKIEQPRRSLGRGDAVVLAALAALLYGCIRLAVLSPAVVRGPDISLAPTSLPLYAGLSLGRMALAYLLSLAFTLIYGRQAATSRRASRVLMPLLDVLQSVPILSFLPVVLLSLAAVLPEDLAVEIASVILIFTSQAWNLTYAWRQSLTTLPKELNEASAIFQFNSWMKFKTLELPFAALGLIWNSVMSWAGGWFFLMAAEIFTVGQRDFRLPGLGAYLQEAAVQGDGRALFWGILTLVAIIVALDSLVWRPLLAWADRFKLEMVPGDAAPSSWFYDALHSSTLVRGLNQRILSPLSEWLDSVLGKLWPARPEWQPVRSGWSLGYRLAAILAGAAILYGGTRAGAMFLALPVSGWVQIGLGLLATLMRVAAALALALLWTVPLGVAIGSNPRLAAVFQPLVQIAASIPATALFPVLLAALLQAPGGLNLGAVLLMLMGSQWYLLFNIIAGAMAIPQDLKYTSAMLQINGWQRWKVLTLPALFPYIVTGAITASGGAWNASIVAEHGTYSGHTYYASGIGALIARATAEGNYALLLAATASMVLLVVLINRLGWGRLYRLAEERFRLD